ncbi:MAG: DUF4214 domain-containing protein [Telluria sp.]
MRARPERAGLLDCGWRRRRRPGGDRAKLHRQREFTALCGKLDNAGFVAHLYRNVLGREPDGAGLVFHVGLLDSGATARNQTLAAFSESPENQAGLVGVIGNGVAYTPFG